MKKKDLLLSDFACLEIKTLAKINGGQVIEVDTNDECTSGDEGCCDSDIILVGPGEPMPPIEDLNL